MFERVVPSVVAILNDDRAEREAEDKRAAEEIGHLPHAPKRIIDVTTDRAPTPHGTGFVIEGGRIVTAAHVIHSPDHLKVKTRAGATVDAELELIDEVRDVAILKPKTALKDVPPLTLATTAPLPGRTVWALGHTGAGLWSLSWGISEGITSGVVDLLGAKTVLFDAPVYPGFSGGPVVMLDDAGAPTVVGVNHAILFAGGIGAAATISSASSADEVRDVLAKRPPAIQPKLAAFAKEQAHRKHAELFITNRLAVHKTPQNLTTAAIMGNQRHIEAGPDDMARVPVVGMVFGMGPGTHELSFELADPHGKVVATVNKTAEVGALERVAFASADFHFDPVYAGRYDVVARAAGKVIGKTDVWIEDPDDDSQPIDDDDVDDTDEGDPRVDVVVAAAGREDPFSLTGIRAGWAEWKYPRRVDFTWFARGSRGWAGTHVAIRAFVLDESGAIVGRGIGCIQPQLRPEKPWSCAGSGGLPLLRREGRYDIVFALNDHPIAMWPMEAVLRDAGRSSMMDGFLQRLREKAAKPMKKRGAKR